MKLKTIIIYIALLTISVGSFGQNKDIETNSITIIPHWNKDDVHAVIFKNSIIETIKGKQVVFLSTFNANFKVLEKSDTEYLVEWTYTNSKLADKDPSSDNPIFSKLQNTKIQIKLSNYGKFIELVNADELKLVLNKIVDELLAKETNSGMKTRLNRTKQEINTKQGLGGMLLKDIKFYYLSFGNNYNLNIDQIHNMKLAFPIGEKPFDAIEKIKLTKLDTKNSICAIETNKTIEGDTLKKTLMEFMKKTDKNHIKEIEAGFDNKKLEVSDKTIQELDFAKGIVKKSYFKRIVYLGIKNEIILHEIESVD